MRNQAEADLSALIESSEDLIWSVDLNFALLTFNRAVQRGIERTLGMRAAVGKRPADLLPPEAAAIWPPLYERALAHGAYRIELPYPSSRTFEIALSPMVMDGKTTGISVFAKDITDQKAAEKALQEAEKKYREIFDGALEGMFQTSPEAKVLIANRSLAKMLGYDSPEDLLSEVRNAIKDAWADPEEHARFTELIAESGAVLGFEAKFRRKNDAIIWCSLSCRKVYGADGQFLYVEGFLEDITERRAVERALLEAEKKYRAIFDGALDGIFQTSIEGKPLAANPALAKMLGYDSAEELITSVQDLSKGLWADPDEREEFLRLLEEQEVIPGYECRFTRKDGTTFWASLSCKRVCEADGRALYLEGFIKDITQRKQATLALAESEARFRRFFEENGSVMLLVEPERGEIVAANRAASEFYEYPREQFAGMLTSQISLGTPEEIALDRQRVLRKEAAYFTYSHRLGSGEVREVELYSSPFEVGGSQYLYAIVHDVTERKQAIEALAESEARFRSLFEENGSVMIVLEPATGKIVDANLAAEEFYGYKREQLIGMPIDRINTLPAEEVALERQRALREERTRFNFCHRLASGEERDVEVYSSPMVVAGKQLLFSVIHDITVRKRAEEALRESLESLEQSQKIGGLGSYSLDICSGTWSSSNVLDELFGIGKDYDHTVAGWVSLIHPDDEPEMAAYFANEVVGQGKPFDREYRIVRQSDGAERWLHGLGKLDFDAQDRPVKMHGVIKDITEQKYAELKLRKSEERFRATFEQAAVGILHTSLEGRILRSNERFAEIAGYPLNEVPGLTFQQITHPDDLGESLGILEQILNGTTVEASWEKRYVRKDGSLTWVKLSTSLQRDEEGRPLHLISVVEDINDRKAAEQRLEAAKGALQASEERYRVAFQTNLDACAITRLDDGKVLEVNRAFTQVHGYEREEAVGRTSNELGVWVDPAQRRAFAAALRENSTCRDLEVRLRRKNGEAFWGLLSASRLEIDGIACIQAAVRDISAAKAAEEQLAAAQQALLASEVRYRTAFQTSLDSMSINRLDDGQYIDINPAFFNIMGYTREEVVGRTSLELGIWVNPPERETMAETLRRNGFIQDLESQFRRKDGTIFWGLSRATRIVLEGVPCLLCVIHDITAAKAAAEALRRSEERYRTAFQTSHDAISISRLEDGLYLDVNQAFLRTFGYKHEEIIGRTSLELLIWADPNDRQKMVDVLRRDSVCENLEVRFRRRSGQVFWVLVSASVIELDGGAFALFVIRDISAAKAASERLAAAMDALRGSETRYRTAFETSLDSINITRLSDGKYVEVNKAFLDVIGYERNEVIGRTSLELGIWADPRDRENVVEILRQNSDCRDYEGQFKKKNGETFWGLMSASQIELDGVPCVLTMTRDISDAKLAEDKIRNLAFYDPLTGLPNRRLLMERLQQSLAAGLRSNQHART